MNVIFPGYDDTEIMTSSLKVRSHKRTRIGYGLSLDTESTSVSARGLDLD